MSVLPLLGSVACAFSVWQASAAAPTAFRVASVQRAIADDCATNLERMRVAVAEASRAWARVVVFPETARTLRLRGARLILDPTYGMSHLDNEWWMRTRSYENQCFIAFAHPQVGFVVGPKGDLIARRTASPGVLLCDIDLSQAKDGNHLRDRRPELYGPIAGGRP